METWTHPFPDQPFSERLAERETIDPAIALDEALLLGLRTARGIDLDAIAALRGASGLRSDQEHTLNRFQREHIILRHGNRLRLTQSHWLWADRVLRELM
jgi:coproporphyrinogen III oxidase-like Fe-S oxidoreductase